jgi:hypothetical protein
MTIQSAKLGHTRDRLLQARTGLTNIQIAVIQIRMNHALLNLTLGCEGVTAKSHCIALKSWGSEEEF